MRIALVAAPARGPGIPGYVAALARGMETLGHRVDILDCRTEDGARLLLYDYVAVCAEPASLLGAVMPEALCHMLAAGRVAGKKSAAFLKKNGPFAAKALAGLMRSMEKEGMLVNWSEIIPSIPTAEARAFALGKQIG
jgi:hypothetical protein